MLEYRLRLMQHSDLPAVNRILAKAFTAARLSDGFKTPRVPLCHLSFLEMYLAVFPNGCFALDDRNGLVGYAFSRLWGEVAWIGPVSIIPAHQGKKLGQQLMVKSLETLQRHGARVIGLETMPRSVHNIGFYTKLGFLPQNLTVDLIQAVPRRPEEPFPADYEVVCYNRVDPAERDSLLAGTEILARRLDPHLSIRAEIEVTQQFSYGDTIFVRRGREVLACFIAHTKTYSEDETPHFMKIVVSLMDASLSVGEILPHLFAFAVREDLGTISFRTPTRYLRAYSELVAAGFKVFHSDLRMTLEGFEEVADAKNFYLCKWE